jgi:pilus assembly protein Flp/PilA
VAAGENPEGGLFMTKLVRAFLEDEGGATAIEYGLIAALVAVAAIVALGALGSELSAIFNAVKSDLANAQAS